VIAVDRVAVLLLAAGRSSRFGADDKLAQPLQGRPLAWHAAATLAGLPFAAHVAVAGNQAASLLPPRFEIVVNERPERGLSHSISLGIAAVEPRDVNACLVALADMPFVPARHFTALLREFHENSEAVIATGAGERSQVPAVFGRRYFGALPGLEGDEGARELLRDAPSIACDPALLADFDRPADFARVTR